MGIQTLLEAEKEASKIVEKARAYRTQKLKDAQSEAEKDIAALKKEKEEGIASFQKQFEGSQSQEQGVLDQDKKQKLAEIKEAFSSKNDELIQKLLDRVASVEPKPHRNLHKIEA